MCAFGSNADRYGLLRRNPPPPPPILPFTSTDGETWYRAIDEVAYNVPSSLQRRLEIVATEFSTEHSAAAIFKTKEGEGKFEIRNASKVPKDMEEVTVLEMVRKHT